MQINKVLHTFLKTNYYKSRTRTYVRQTGSPPTTTEYKKMHSDPDPQSLHNEKQRVSRETEDFVESHLCQRF